MALKKMKLGTNKQHASQQPVMRVRRQGTPIVDRRVPGSTDPDVTDFRPSGDERPYQDIAFDNEGVMVPDSAINKAGS